MMLKKQQLYFLLDCIVSHLYLSSIDECDEWVSPFFKKEILVFNFNVCHNNAVRCGCSFLISRGG